jgi:uncharacterized protein (TIGR02246 family)
MNDEEAIRRTLAGLPLGWDNRDPDGLSRLFLEHGRFISPAGNVYEGRAAIKKFSEDFFASVKPDRVSNHCDGEYAIAVSDDRAEASGDGVVYERFGEGPWRLKSLLHYTNRLVRTDGEWLLAESRSDRVWSAAGDMIPPRW